MASGTALTGPHPWRGWLVDRLAAITVSDEFAGRRWMAEHRHRAVPRVPGEVRRPVSLRR